MESSMTEAPSWVSTKNRPRVALLTNVLSHYRVPCFRELANVLQEDIRFYVLTRAMAHRQYVLAGEEHDLPIQFLPGLAWPRRPFDDLHLSDVRPLCRDKPDVVILASWSEPSFLLVWMWALLRRKPILFWTESTENDRPRGRFKNCIKRFLLRHASGCIVPGRRSSAYCRVLGMAEDRIFIAPNATERHYFRSKANELAPQRDRMREELGLKGFTILFVGRLVEYFKGVESLLRACSILEKDDDRLSVLLVGDGPDRHRYERLVREESLRSVCFLGTLERDALCRYYAVADVLVLPSRSETWGFVLNEAMEFGLPLVVSDRVGAAPELLPDGENGFVVPVADVAALTSGLRTLSKDADLRRRMSEASRRIIEGFTPQRWAQGVLSAVEAGRNS